MDLRAQSFRSFVVLAEEASFTRAAQRLNMTQSALSMRLRDLEKQLEVTLFHRTSRSVVLTEEGAELLDQARRIVAATDRFRQMAHELRTHPERALTFGLPLIALDTDEWMRWINAFRDAEPGVAVRLVRQGVQDMLAGLREDRIDACFMAGQPPADLEALVLARRRIDMAIPEEWPLAQKEVLTVADLAGLPVAAFDRELSHGFYAQTIARLEQAGMRLETSPEGIIGAGFATRARIAGIVPEGVAIAGRDRMVRRTIEGFGFEVDLCAVRSPGSTRRVLRRFWVDARRRAASISPADRSTQSELAGAPAGS